MLSPRDLGGHFLAGKTTADLILGGNSNKFLRPGTGRFDYDSSSGVASSATSTSISSIYEEFTTLGGWNSSLPHVTPPTRIMPRQFINNNNNNNNKNLAVATSSTQQATASIYDKVMLWIKNTEKSSDRTCVTGGGAFCQVTNQWIDDPRPRTSSIIVENPILSSLAHTDSTSKTDQSNFTYFIWNTNQLTWDIRFLSIINR